MYLDGVVTNYLSSMNTSCLLDTGSGDALWLFEKTEDFEIPKKGFRDYLGFGIPARSAGDPSITWAT